jgi:hypothetical protein
VRSVGNGFGNGEFYRRPSGLVPVIRRGVVSRMNAALHALVLVCHSPKRRNSAPSFVCVVTKSMVSDRKHVIRHRKLFGPSEQAITSASTASRPSVDGCAATASARASVSCVPIFFLRNRLRYGDHFRELMPRTHKQRVILGRIEALSTNGQREEMPVPLRANGFGCARIRSAKPTGSSTAPRRGRSDLWTHPPKLSVTS